VASPTRTLQNIRDHVRSYTDTDSTDLTDSLVDQFVQAAFDEVAYAERLWSFYQQDGTFNTVADTQQYSLVSILGGTNEIIAIQLADAYLRPIGHQLATEVFVSTASGTPTHFSQFEDSLFLWPTPSSAVAVAYQGHREPNDWIADGSGATPDLPSEYHAVVQQGALIRALDWLDEQEQAAANRQQYDRSLQAVSAIHRGIYVAGPMVLNGGSPPASPVPGELKYDWDY
jgi:hypothetical protein